MKKSKLTLNKEIITNLNSGEMKAIEGGYSDPGTCGPYHTCEPGCENPGQTQEPGCGGGTVPCLETHDTCPPTSCDVDCGDPAPTQDPGCGGQTIGCPA